ncbi:small S protein [Colletotrichum sojae]|uniref:Small S protein n=1 Tax=Colletotrichum sojae TaxID=2175907 RepID=A0A8H6JEZ6_9PEZI|nr:small S protein [Colletotrichum sojae]
MPYLTGILGGGEARSRLISAAVERSEGIFLWLRLVVESLIQELDVCDQISDLLSVLDRFPRGLEALFLQMMRRMLVNSENRGLQCLWLMRRSLNVESLQSPRISGGSKDCRFRMTAFFLDGAQMQFKALIELEPINVNRSRLTDTIHKVENRLRSWCAGLLEMKRGSGGDPEISFIHRSVTEFLDLSSTRSELMDGLSNMAKDVEFSLMKGLLARIKRGTSGDIFGNDLVWCCVELIVRLARFVDDSHKDMAIVLLSELNRTMAAQLKEDSRTDCDWTSYYPWTLRKIKRGYRSKFYLEYLERSAGFLSIIVESGLVAPALHMLGLPGLRRTMQTSRGVPLLSSACRPPPFSIVIPGSIRPTLIAKILELGADPNQEYKNIVGKITTPWQDLLRTVNELQCRTIESARQLSRIVAMMLEHGANPYVEVELYDPRDQHSQRLKHDYRVPKELNWSLEAADVDSAAQMAHILNATEIISRAFIEAPGPRYVGNRESLLGDFVPFEDVDPHWELEAEVWGRTYGATYPLDAAPPPLAVVDKEQIAKMGHSLLEVLDQKSAVVKSGRSRLRGFFLKRHESRREHAVSAKEGFISILWLIPVMAFLLFLYMFYGVSP